ncbi:PilT protein domain protein [Fulvivirga imtechensis AK7]|uniref:Ribonuclease VapC n=1 Tax=Fulvivirga imtechensis AK7 TaxID=1237149 RepID=L8JPQ5_9BACT|nr:PIN domain-containing protein [Fulvivirga imtechensis]ELR69494.1 PilT protein domain protein [Fulvivirga imtechensis AK7]
MTGPIIADTSVWIGFFKGIESEAVTVLVDYIENDKDIYLCPAIVQEVLQGIRNDKQYREIKNYLLAFNILNDDGLEMAISAANLYRALRKKGVTIRKSNDCLIAQYAIKHSLAILHKDRDFDLIINNHK